MAFGLTPRYMQDFPIEDMTPEEFLIIAIETAKNLNWDVGYTSVTGFTAFTGFSVSSWSEEFKVKIKNNVARLKSECIGNQMADWGKNKENINHFISTFKGLKNTFTAEDLAYRYEELKTKLDSKDDDALNEPPSSTKEKLTGFISIFKPTQGYFITPIIINLNIAIFILMMITGVSAILPDSESLINWGANFRPATLNGEWWRLITNCFLHIGVIHLLMNMYAFIYIGLLLEPHLDKTLFAAAYLLTGISASVASLWWHELSISAGASGAIFGMYGVFLAMLTTNLIEKAARKALLTSIVIFVAYNLMNGVKGGIDNAAHIGGLVSGLIIGYAYFPGLKKPGEVFLKFSTVGLLAFVVIISSFTIYKQLPNDFGEYDSKMIEFAALEAKAIKIYSLPEDVSNEQLLAETKKGLYYWNENIKLIKGLEKLNLPEPLHERNRKLLLYCDLRIKIFNLIYRGLVEDTEKYLPQIEAYNKQIESIIEELTGE